MSMSLVQVCTKGDVRLAGVLYRPEREQRCTGILRFMLAANNKSIFLKLVKMTKVNPWRYLIYETRQSVSASWHSFYLLARMRRRQRM